MYQCLLKEPTFFLSQKDNTNKCLLVRGTMCLGVTLHYACPSEERMINHPSGGFYIQEKDFVDGEIREE